MSLDRQHCETARAALASLEDEERFKRILQEANRGNVSFYPIGPGGFSATYEPMSVQNRSLHMMADLTDGATIVQPTEMESGLRRMVADLSSYYLAGYYSTAKPDGKFHRITVRVKRPGIDVRARTGYLASVPAAGNAIAKRPISPADAADARLISRALGELEALVREDPPRPASARADGVRFFRRGVTTGNTDAATGDLRYRRTERLAIEMPAPSADTFTARLLDRTGKPLNVPAATSVRDQPDGSHHRRVDVTLAPLAPGDYIVEIVAGADRILAAFRIVP
jgi:hypothetical protein